MKFLVLYSQSPHLAILPLIIITSLSSFVFYSKDILNRHEILRDDIYEVDWTVDFSAEEITFFVTAKTRGFVGFGISYTGSMQHSDIVIGGVFENGTTYFSVSHLHTRKLKSISRF